MNPPDRVAAKRRASFRWGSLCWLWAVALLGCAAQPEALPPRAPVPLVDPAWFGPGLPWVAGEPGVLLAVRPGLHLQGQPLEVTPWEAPKAPRDGTKPSAGWLAHRDRVVALHQALLAGGLALQQGLPPPPGSAPAYRVQARLLAFDRETRVAAKSGQVLANTVLIPVNLAALFLSNGGLSKPLVIEGVSGYRTEALVQVKLVEVATGATVLGYQADEVFLSLEVPLSLPRVLGRAFEPPTYEGWLGHELTERDGDLVWFKPGLDLRGRTIRCLPWRPGTSLFNTVPEQQVVRGLPHVRLPRMLVEAGLEAGGPRLSTEEGALCLQGEVGASKDSARPSSRVRLWDPLTGETLALLTVRRGFWRTDAEADWVRRIGRHLRAQVGAGAP